MMLISNCILLASLKQAMFDAACRSTADARFEPQCRPAVATAISDDSKQQGQERKVEEDDYIIHYDFDCGYLCAPDF